MRQSFVPVATIAFSALASAIATSGSCYQSVSVLNGGFEDGSLADWSLSGVSSTSGLVNDPALASSGNYYFSASPAVVDADGSPISERNIGLYRYLEGTPDGQNYVYSFDWKISLNGASGCRMFAEYDQDDGWFLDDPILEDVTSWTHVSYLHPTKPSGWSVYILLNCASGVPTLELDNINISYEKNVCIASSSAAASSTPVASSTLIRSSSALASSFTPIHSSTPSILPSSRAASSGSILPSGSIDPLRPSTSLSPVRPHKPSGSCSVKASSSGFASSVPVRSGNITPSGAASASTSAIPSGNGRHGGHDGHGGHGGREGHGGHSSHGSGRDSSSSAPPSPSSGGSSGNGSGSDSGSGELTTSTVFSTRTSTITACPPTITNCPARDQTTYVTTETIVVSTTICPATAEATTTAPAGSPYVTTETILSTRISKIHACPSSVTNCPAHQKTSSATTETLVAGTTVYTVTPSQAIPTTTGPAVAGSLNTETIYATSTATVFECPASVTDCPLREKTAHAVTSTVTVGTTTNTVSVSAIETSTAGSNLGSGSGPDSGEESVISTKTYSKISIYVPTGVGAGGVNTSTSAFATSSSAAVSVSASAKYPVKLSTLPVGVSGTSTSTSSSTGPTYTGAAISQLTMPTALAIICGLGAIFPFIF